MAGTPIVGSAYGPFWEGFRLAPANQHPESRKSPAGQHNQKKTINLTDGFTEAVPALRSCQIIAVFQSSDTRLLKSFSQNDPVTSLA